MTMLGCRKSSWQSYEGEGPIGSLVADFDQHLTKVCGLSAATRFYRRRYAREFLKWRFEGKRWDLTKLCFSDFVDYVKLRAPRLKPGSVGVMMTSLRTLVRFLEFKGRCHTGLSQTWPTVPNWKQSPPSDVLTAKLQRPVTMRGSSLPFGTTGFRYSSPYDGFGAARCGDS